MTNLREITKCNIEKEILQLKERAETAQKIFKQCNDAKDLLIQFALASNTKEDSLFFGGLISKIILSFSPFLKDNTVVNISEEFIEFRGEEFTLKYPIQIEDNVFLINNIKLESEIAPSVKIEEKHSTFVRHFEEYTHNLRSYRSIRKEYQRNFYPKGSTKKIKSILDGTIRGEMGRLYFEILEAQLEKAILQNNIEINRARRKTAGENLNKLKSLIDFIKLTGKEIKSIDFE